MAAASWLSLRSATFNRTILELKESLMIDNGDEYPTFNRTILELKEADIIQGNLQYLELLIVPYWN